MKLFRKIDTKTGLFIEDVLLMDGFMGNEEFINTEVPQCFYWPKWTGTEWVEGGQAPEPTAPQLSTDEKLTQMAEQLVITQANIEAAQEALDFLYNKLKLKQHFS